MKKIFSVILTIFLLTTAYGCFAIFAGAAAGTGTAVWLSGKLTQQFDSTFDRTIIASRNALNSLELPIRKETRENKFAQLKSEYYDGKEIWIDIRYVTETSTKVEARVGALSADKEASEKILKRIQTYL